MSYEILDDDYVITDCGRLGSMYCCNQGIGQYAEYDELLQAIHDDMERQQFWPNLWYVNDHGNVDLLCLVSKNSVFDTEIAASWV